MTFLKYKDFLTEGKQVGNLYHYTYLVSALQIVDKNKMRVSRLHDTISFTRDKNFHKNSFIFKKEGKDVRFVFDGNKLSNNYKIRPYDYFGDLTTRSSKSCSDVEFQAEEQIERDILNVKKYLIRIDLPSMYSYDGTLTPIGDSIMWLKKLTGETIIDKKYLDLEEELCNVNDARDWFESKNIKVGFYR